MILYIIFRQKKRTFIVHYITNSSPFASFNGIFLNSKFLIKFSIDPDKVNPKYVKYYCLSQEYKGWIASYNTGSTRGNINAKTLAQMPLVLPERMQQD